MPRPTTSIDRRAFLAGSVSTGLVMGLGMISPGYGREQVVEDIGTSGSSPLFAPTVWFEINVQGEILINIAEAEMGQHVGTALARIVADELGADWSKVSIRHVDSDPKWGYMITASSWSVFTSFETLSRAGAAGRIILIDAGAKLLGVDPTDCQAMDSMIIASDRSISYADVVAKGDIRRAFTEEELAALPIKSASERRLIGKATAALDVPAKSAGEATYGLDVELPGMVYACPLMPPTRYGSSIRSIEDMAAKSIAGYLQTLKLTDPSAILQGWALVVAETFPAAMGAAEAVNVDWNAGPTAAVGETDIFEECEKLAAQQSSGVMVVDHGDIAGARKDSAKTLSSTYRTSSVLHFALEPQNALVEFVDGVFHIHAGNQWQSLIIPMLAAALQVPEFNIVVHQYYLGGGFGRRGIGDQMIPAALAARQLGRPVKLIFPRAEDSRFDCVRSPSLARLDAFFDSEGALTGIEHAAAAGWPSLAMAPFLLVDGIDGNGKFDPFSISGADHWYTLPKHRVRAISSELARRTFLPGYLRSVGPGWIGWGVECFMDELAAMSNEDPVAFRLRRLDGTGSNAGTKPHSVGGARRLAAVLNDVTKRAGWGRKLPKGEALGVAISQGQERVMPTWTACVVHVAVDAAANDVKVKKVWQTIDCGTVVHPDGAMAQAESATLWGLSVALHEGTEIVDGEVGDQNLDSYSPLRMADVPELDIQFMDSSEFPTGLGEPPMIAVAPAIGNAIFAATGIRVRDLPIRL
jgi:isoquinoline 1-oxidoreductase subunit beta